MRHWLLVCLMACHSETINIPIANHDAAIESPVSLIDAGDDDNAAPALVEPQRILLIGDSQVLYLQSYFSRANVKKPNETVWLDSKPGTTILTWNNIFVMEMSKFPTVDMVLIFLGTNNNNFTYLQPLDSILQEVQRRDIKCLWSGGTEVYYRHHPIINNLIHHAVEPVCKFFDTEASGIELLDGVHPSLKGGVKWLQLVWQEKDRL